MHSADGSVQGEGALFLHDLRLPAFSPHDQRLTLDRTSLLFNLSRQGAAAWQVRQLRLESPLANLDLHGALQPGESDFTAQAARKIEQFVKSDPDVRRAVENIRGKL